jgi:hypothetical protein
VWNQVLGVVHPTLQVTQFMAGFTPLDISVGDGSDGPFDHTTYAQFSAGGDISGNIIRLDTSAHPILQVTQFTLDAGWTLQPTGGNPLVIESLSTVTVLGTIDCQGGNGTAAAGGTNGTGGVGRCGGKNGGDGGPANLPGTNGSDAGAAVTGGIGGNLAPVVGGGGGGSWSAASPPTNGANSSASGGQAGTFFSDPQFLTVAGGAGGGGGSGDAAAAGGGGGAGGGVVLIRAVGDVDIGATAGPPYVGYILVGGGNGGNAGGTGGPGGGGGGGSVQIFTAGALNLINADPAGASQAPGGGGGTNAAAAGGTGGLGRSWVSTSTFFTGGTGTYSPIEEFPVNTGQTEFSPSTQFVITRSFDTGGNFAQVSGVSFSPSSSDFAYQLDGSDDGFVSDDTGWTSNPAVVSNKRYLRMKFEITTSNVNSPTMLDTATLTFAQGSPGSFQFQSAGCGRITNTPTPTLNLFLLLFAPLLLLVSKIKAQRQVSRK